MKTALKSLLILIVLQPILANPLSALEVTARDEYMLDARGDDGDIYRSYISLDKKIESPSLNISLFLESQWHFDRDEWEKLLLGGEIRKSLWKYLYVGQSVQFVSGQMLDYVGFEIDNKSFDTTTKIKIDIPFLESFSFQAFEEYSFNLEELEGDYNELGAEIVFKPRNFFSIFLGWRHTDRIHNFDTDYATAGLSFHF